MNVSVVSSPLQASTLHLFPQAVIIITFLSAGNSSLYLTSRILVGLAREGRAPRWMGHTNKRGVPWPALIFSNLFGLLALLKYAKGSGSGKVFGYLMSLSGVSTFIVWGSESPSFPPLGAELS